jgi:hypothetical protein
MRSALKAGFAYFAIVFAAGFVLGTVRTLWLVRTVGEVAAVLIELPIILAVSWFACIWVVRSFAVPRSTRHRALVGGIAFLLLMLAELCLAVLLFGRSPEEFAASLATPAGVIGLAGQIAFATFPLLESGRRR